MGIARGAIALLMEEATRRPFSGSVATLGKQAVYITGERLATLFRKFSLSPRIAIGAGRKAIDDETLLKALGFDEVHSFDYSDYEGATHVFDLNSEKLSDDFANSYDVVLDSGTIEHVFHIPNVLKNIYHMTKVGGRVIFLAPSSNHVDHGFYMFSPTFFVDYYSANGFEIETIYVVRYYRDLDELWDIYEYIPGTWYDVSLGGLDGQPYAIFFVATKTAASAWDVVPQQGYYADHAPHYAGSTLAGRSCALGAEGTAPFTAPGVAQNVKQGELAVPLLGGRVMRAIKTIIVKKIPGAVRVAHNFRRWVAIQREVRSLPGDPPGMNQRKPIGKRLVARY
jgi:SAM-dependent methyltransferase